MSIDYGRLFRGLLYQSEEPLSEEELLRMFKAGNVTRLARDLFSKARAQRSERDFALAMLICAKFDLYPKFGQTMLDALNEDWHSNHEDIAFQLGILQVREAVPALVKATTWVPHYLKFDEFRVLAVKAIYSLARIPTDEAVEALAWIAEHAEDKIVSWNARERLRQRLDGSWP